MSTPVVVRDNDVLFGRGFTISAHPGNRHLRSIVQNKKTEFLKARKKQKRVIAKLIVDEIQVLDPPGRFLMEDPNSISTASGGGDGKGDDNGVGSDKEGILDKDWIVVDTDKAVDKVMHRLREKERAPPEGPTILQFHQQHLQHLSFGQQVIGGNQLAQNPNFIATALQQQQQQQQLQQQQGQQMSAIGAAAAAAGAANQQPPLTPDDLQNYLQTMQQTLGTNFLSNALGSSTGTSTGIYSPQHTNSGVQQQQQQQQQNMMQNHQQLQQMGGLGVDLNQQQQMVQNQPLQQMQDLSQQQQMQNQLSGLGGIDLSQQIQQQQIQQQHLTQQIQQQQQKMEIQQQIGGLGGGEDLSQQIQLLQQTLQQNQAELQRAIGGGGDGGNNNGLFVPQTAVSNGNMNIPQSQIMSQQSPQLAMNNQPGGTNNVGVNNNMNRPSPQLMNMSSPSPQLMNNIQQQQFQQSPLHFAQPQNRSGSAAMSDMNMSSPSPQLMNNNQHQQQFQQPPMMSNGVVTSSPILSFQPNSRSNSVTMSDGGGSTTGGDAESSPSMMTSNSNNSLLQQQPRRSSSLVLVGGVPELQSIHEIQNNIGGMGNNNDGNTQGSHSFDYNQQHQHQQPQNFQSPGQQLPTFMKTSPLHQQVPINEQVYSLENLANAGQGSGDTLKMENGNFDGGLLGTFLNDLTASSGQPPQQQCDPLSYRQVSPGMKEITVREWLERASKLISDQPMYIQLIVLPLALKVTEYLIESEKNQGLVPSECITCDLVWVQLKDNLGDNDVKGCSGVDTIDSVIIKSSVGIKSNVGGDMQHLHALGAMLYEIISRGDTISGPSSNSALTVQRLDLGEDDGSRRSRRKSSRSQSDTHGDSIAKLELLGVPQPLSFLVTNLLDCSQGEFRGDDAYHSLKDVRTDLQLMRDDPSRFLYNLQVGANPTFEIRTKFYGRKDDISRIEESHRMHMSGSCGGIILSGRAGVGKSYLLSDVTKKLALRTNAYFLETKFDQSNDVNPLSKIAAIFNEFCDSFARDASQSQLDSVSEALEGILGNQASLLVGVVPSLTKLISFTSCGTSSECIDAAASMQFLFKNLLEVLSQHKRVILYLDDLQWADPSSLLLIASIISSTKESSNVYFAMTYRDDNIQEGGPFSIWLSSISAFPLEKMQILNINSEGVNELISETLHLPPRLTLPLASVLHHKTGGNPFFVTQLLESLREQSYIYVSLNPPRWAWEFDKIVNLEISDDVVALLVQELQRLPVNLQLALKVASCIGSSMSTAILDILSADLEVNLRDLLDQVVQKGLMVHVNNTKIRFAHDKIQQAAYEMIPAQQQLENHMRFGLALCSQAMNGSEGDDELFFAAVNQINRAGPAVLSDMNQKMMIAALNLKAGKRTIEMSDFSAALALFQHGISFLDNNESWASQYSLNLELYDAAVETACALNDAGSVRRLSAQVLANARCKDDKLSSLYAVVKSLRLAYKFVDSKKVAYTMLEQLGEGLPRPSDDPGLVSNLDGMKVILEGMSDESILNMHETNQKKEDILLLNLYHDLNFLFQFVDPTRIADTSLRMVQITLSNGLCCMSPLALAQFSIVLVTMRETTLAYRVGTLALKLVDKINAQRYTSAVIALVGTLVSWVAEPLQSIAESHLLGFKYGQRNGDTIASQLNYQFSLQISYLCGKNLDFVRDKSKQFVYELLQRKQQFLRKGAWTVYLQATVFVEGLDYEEGEEHKNLPRWNDLEKGSGAHLDFSLVMSTHRFMRAVMFKKYGELPQEGMLDRIFARDVPLRPIFYYGVFFEGLICFHFARQTDGDEFLRKGEAALKLFKALTKCSTWNFENFMLLLEAENMNFSGYDEQASQSYDGAVRSSHEHKFIHLEAVSAELAAAFYYDQGHNKKAYALYRHAVHCYNKWGGFAVARRVENEFQGKFGANFDTYDPAADTLMVSLLAPTNGSSKRRGSANENP